MKSLCRKLRAGWKCKLQEKKDKKIRFICAKDFDFYRMLLNQHGQFPRKSIVRCLEKRRKWEGGGNLHGIYMYVFFYDFWQDTMNHL